MKKIMLYISVMLALSSTLYAQNKSMKSVSWKKVGVLPETNGRLLGFAGPVGGVTDEVFIAGGGANFPDSMPWLGGKKRYYDELVVYKSTEKDSLIAIAQGRLPIPLGYAACVSTEKGIVIAGGENERGPSDKVFLLNWNKKDASLEISSLPDLPLPLTSASIVEHQGTVFLAGGISNDGTSNRFFSLHIDSDSAGWVELDSLPLPTSNAVMATGSGVHTTGIYLLGGRKSNPDSPSDLYSAVYDYDLTKKKWKQSSFLPYALSAGTGINIDKHHIVLFGGDRGEVFHKTEELIFAIQKEEDKQKKDSLMKQKEQVQSTHPGFSREILLYNTRQNTFEVIGHIPFETPVTTEAVKWKNRILIPGGEIRAGVRSPYILEAKIKR